MDDDVRCHLLATGANDSLSIGFGPDTFRTEWLADADCIERAHFNGEDLLALHEAALGSGSEPEDAWCLADVSHLTPGCFLKFTQPSRVAVSLMGVLGDPGVDHPLTLVPHLAEDITRLTSAFPGGFAAIRNRLVLRGTGARVISPNLLCMSYCMGINNEALMPPFHPIRRAAEWVWGKLVERCVDGALSATIPYSIRHEPLGIREFSPDAAYRHAARFSTGEILAMIVRAEEGLGVDISAGLYSLGTRIRELGNTDLPDFEARLRKLVDPSCQTLIVVLDALAANAGCPVWRAEARRLQDAALTAWNTGDHVVPIDLPPGNVDRGQALGKLQSTLGRFGELLQVWPELVAASNRIAPLSAYQGG